MDLNETSFTWDRASECLMSVACTVNHDQQITLCNVFLHLKFRDSPAL